LPDSWLFEKGDSSVRIVRTGSLMFEVCGPGTSRERHAFTQDDELVSFLHDTVQQLTAFGYRPRGYGYERRAIERPPSAGDRRQN
jgi:hypothetical protein